MRRPITYALLVFLLGSVPGVASAQPSAGGPREPRSEAPGRTPPIENAAAVRPFFRALERTRRQRTITRVTHLGDSSIGLDDLPHRLRQAYQARHGDAGPGFVLLQPHTRSYMNRTVHIRPAPAWDICFIIHRCARDHRYGLGGVSATSRRGARTRITPRPGRSVTRAELWYAAHETGGEIEVRFGDGDAAVERLSTRAASVEDRWQALRREAGEHTLQVTARGGGLARVYGVVLENEGPGVVWDSLSMIGAFTHRLLAQDEAHFAAQLSHRDPELVVLNYGGNDLRRLVGHVVDEAEFQDETTRLLRRVRRAVPDAGCLLVSINDHEASGDLEVEERHVEAIVRAQRAAANAAGCGFWDQVAAMGGPGSYRRWRMRGLAASDGKHLAPRGRDVIAARLVAALDHAAGQ